MNRQGPNRRLPTPLVAPLVGIAVALATLAAPARPQGVSDYLNFESVQCKPVTVARFAGHDYLLVCNTPDNSLEIYDTTEGAQGPQFLDRIAVGLEPVSVVYDATTSRFYTCNALGDSVSLGILFDPPGAGTFAAQLTRTVNVGDEPTHLAVDTARDCLWVSLRSRSALALLHRTTLEPVGLGVLANDDLFSDPAFNDRVFLTNDGVYVESQGAPGVGTRDATMAVKQPHTVLLDTTGEDDHLIVLGYRGGGDPAKKEKETPMSGPHPNHFDLDVWSFDFDAETVATVPTPVTVSTEHPDGLSDSLGTTNFNMALRANGDLFVVSAEAQNDVLGNENLSDPMDTPTGFVTTLLHRVSGATGGNPVVATRDLNTTTSGVAVAKTASLAHCTDVALYEPAAGGTYVCVTGFNSDGVGLVDVSNADPANWTIARYAVSGSTDDLRGPRGVAVKLANGGQTGDPGDRIYVLNRLDNSLTVLDPANPASPSLVADLSLNHDPRPARQLDGQQFLYSARFSGSGFVSCSSCHVDGRTDGLVWFVTKPDSFESQCGLDQYDFLQPYGAASSLSPPALKFEMSHGEADETNAQASGGFDNNKGPMLTQSLQGLVNYEMEGGFQDLVTNAPYHWRGDKQAFQDFNEAFHNLQALTDVNMDACDAAGLSASDMDDYTTFINTIHYPPNPDQPLDRRYSGTLGSPGDESSGSGARRGLKLYHTAPHIQGAQAGTGNDITGGRSCVQCHSLPEGSNNRITDRLDTASFGTFEGSQTIETAQLRDLVQREERLVLSPSDFDTAEPLWTNNYGFRHNGTAEGTLNDFTNQGTFKGSGFENASMNTVATGLNDTGSNQKVIDVVSFLRELDWGVAPVIGQTITVTSATKNAQATTDRLDLFEAQVEEANAGLAVYLRGTGGERGFWYRLSHANGPGYQETPVSGAPISRATLLGLLGTARDMAVFTAVPLGSERRVASLTGQGEVLQGSSPNSIEFDGTTPNTAHVEIPSLVKNWPREEDDDLLAVDGMGVPGVEFFDWLDDGATTFFWLGTFEDTSATFGIVTAPHPLSLGLQRVFQQALASYGVAYQHDAPRRIRFKGNNIREGAKAAVFMNSGTPAMPAWVPMLVNVYPRLIDGPSEPELVWETAVEFEPEEIYMFVAGGPWAAGVVDMFDGDFGEFPLTHGLVPAVWNDQYLVYIQNEDLTQGANGGVTVPFLY